VNCSSGLFPNVALVFDAVTASESPDTFPRQYARTQRFTLGEPRDLVVSPDGRRVVFARSRGGSDPVNCLWVADVGMGREDLVVDPVELLAGALSDDLPPEERARRERAREAASGVTTFATDQAVTVAAFALAGRLFGAGLMTRRAREIPVSGPVFDPRPDPLGRRIAYVSGRELRVAELDGSSRTVVAEPGDPDTVSWGSADFIAAEEMNRQRGFWWSPDGTAIAACRVDVRGRARVAHRQPGRSLAATGSDPVSGGRHHEPRGDPPRVPTRRWSAGRGRVGPRAASPTSPRSTGQPTA
jgi:dipeptidyl-peptidase 4